MHLIVYLHGFKSSPSSTKSCLTKAAIYDRIGKGAKLEWYGPQLPPSPKEAMQMVTTYIDERNYQQLSIIGSSLGGYYATYLGEIYGPPCRVSLLNPAIEPARDLEKYIGQQKSWHDDETFYFKQAYIQELKDLYRQTITQLNRYHLLAATGDEVLDWQEMVSKYAGVNQHILDGGDHAITDYPSYLSEILQFHLD